jgi:hypothetical protein
MIIHMYHILYAISVHIEAFYKTLLLRQAWLPQGHRRLVPRKKVRRYKKKPASIVPEGVNTANKL